MAFQEVTFPVNISYGSKGGPAYNSSVIVMDSGNEERVQRWVNAKRHYDVSYGIKSREDLQAVLQFFLNRAGAVYGFRYKDWLDFNSSGPGHNVPPDGASNVSATDQQIGSGDGSTHQFQLIKIYTDTGNLITRNITKPVSGTVQIALNGSNTGGSGWTADTTTGIITFTTAPGIGVAITAGFEFDTPVRFEASVDQQGLLAAIDDYGHGSIQSIPLIEVTDGLTVNDAFNQGGAAEVCLSANWLMSASFCRAYVFEPQSGGLSVILPDTTNLPTGGPEFYIFNLGSFSLTVKTFGGGTLATLSPNQAATLILTLDGGGSRTWYLV